MDFRDLFRSFTRHALFLFSPVLKGALIGSFFVFATLSSADASTSPFAALEDLFDSDGSVSDPNLTFIDSQNVVSLLDYLRSTVGSRNRIPDYDRSTDFGTWIYPNPAICKNTRALVLIRDANPAVAIQYTNAGECSVATGLWNDSYTAHPVKKARDLDIDHVVPLHDAWLSGAYRWNRHRRCHYTNYMQNKIHLRPVSSSQNRVKGDRTPAEFMPEDRSAACAYLSDWMKIKMIWELSATPDEVNAVDSLFRAHRCGAGFATLSVTDLMNQRQLSQTPQKACVEDYNQPYYRPDDV